MPYGQRLRPSRTSLLAPGIRDAVQHGSRQRPQLVRPRFLKIRVGGGFEHGVRTRKAVRPPKEFTHRTAEQRFGLARPALHASTVRCLLFARG